MNEQSQGFVESVRDLRRYAHALMGTRQRGDVYVMACLQVLRNEPARVNDDSGDIRLGMFKLFHSIWDTVELGCNPTGRPGVDALDADDPEAGYGPVEDRQILLLVTLLKFSAVETADILGVREARVLEVLDGAHVDFRERLMHVLAASAYAGPANAFRRPTESDLSLAMAAATTRRRGHWSHRRDQPRTLAVDESYMLPPAAPQLASPSRHRPGFDRKM